jgi:hypothetical protein
LRISDARFVKRPADREKGSNGPSMAHFFYKTIIGGTFRIIFRFLKSTWFPDPEIVTYNVYG